MNEMPSSSPAPQPTPRDNHDEQWIRFLQILLFLFCPLFFLNKFIYFIYLFLAALGLRCCVRAFSSCGERGLLFVAVRGLLIVVASRCGAWALGARAQ